MQAYNADRQVEYLKLSLKWLGLALCYEPDLSLWDYARQHDPELAPIREMIGEFLIDLRKMIPLKSDTIDESEIDKLVVQALKQCNDR